MDVKGGMARGYIDTRTGLLLKSLDILNTSAV